MGDRSAIQWTDATWNPVRGCTRVSAGCRRCYAERSALRMAGPGGAYEGLVENTSHGPRWTGRVHTIDEKLDEPLHWRKGRRVFVNSMSDLFHDAVHDYFIDRVFAVMGQCPQHTFQVLTKRPERMRAYLSDDGTPRRIMRCFADATGPHPAADLINLSAWFPLANVWLGVSVEDQVTWDERVEHLGATSAAVRFVSVEPMLGRIDAGNGFDPPPEGSPYKPVDWVICGGESGPGARPMHLDWARWMRDQCVGLGVPFFFKQWGGATPKAGGRLLDGHEWNQYP